MNYVISISYQTPKLFIYLVVHISVWIHQTSFCPKVFNPLLLFFLLMYQWFPVWPVGAGTSWLQCHLDKSSITEFSFFFLAHHVPDLSCTVFPCSGISHLSKESTFTSIFIFILLFLYLSMTVENYMAIMKTCLLDL